MRFFKLSPADAYLRNAAIPDADSPDTAARPFYLAAAEDGGSSGRCLAQAVYYEAGSESLAGKRAVAQVLLNRVRDPRFPKTVCGVVFEGSTLRTGCQFSFTCDGSLHRPPSPAGWLSAESVAEAALAGAVMKAVGHATHYHNVWVTPYWAPSLVKWGRLGSHIFYRWTGGGARAAIGLGYVAAVQPSVPQRPPLTPSVASHATVALQAPSPSASPLSLPTVPAVLQPPPVAPPATPVAKDAPSLAADAPYQASRPGPGLGAPHFAARDHI